MDDQFIKRLQPQNDDGVCVYAVNGAADFWDEPRNSRPRSEKMAFSKAKPKPAEPAPVATVVAVHEAFDLCASSTVRYQWAEGADEGEYVTASRDPLEVSSRHRELPAAIEEAKDVAVKRMRGLLRKRGMIERRNREVEEFFLVDEA